MTSMVLPLAGLGVRVKEKRVSPMVPTPNSSSVRILVREADTVEVTSSLQRVLTQKS